MPRPHGFDRRRYEDGTVVVTHHGRTAATLRGDRARRFLAETGSGDPQEVMARWTGNHRRGNHRRGNQRTARNHPRNRRRAPPAKGRARRRRSHAAAGSVSPT
ncbi:hypothetical protein [Streptomyces glaucosporus]